MCTPCRSSAPTWPSRSTSIAELIDTSDRAGTARLDRGCSWRPELDREHGQPVVQRRAQSAAPVITSPWSISFVAGRHALLDQAEDAVGDHPGVEAEVGVAGQGPEHRARQRADARSGRCRRPRSARRPARRSTRSAASGSRTGASRSGRSVSIVAAKADSGRRQVPLVRGIWRLTSAIRVGVYRSASATYSIADAERDQAVVTGAETCSSPTSHGSRPRANIRGSDE